MLSLGAVAIPGSPATPAAVGCHASSGNQELTRLNASKSAEGRRDFIPPAFAYFNGSLSEGFVSRLTALPN